MINGLQLDVKFASGGEVDVSNTFNGRCFKAYKGNFCIFIENARAVKVALLINGRPVEISDYLKSEHGTLNLNIDEFIHDGVNTIYISDIQPADAFINIRVPYPKLVDYSSSFNSSITGFSTTKLDEIDKLINSEIEKGFPGAVLQIIKDGKIIKKTAYGYKRKYADGGKLLDTYENMEIDTVFDIASNSKMYSTNFALMKLVSEGRLDVNKPVKEYITEYRGGRRDEIIVKDLLNHIAGYAPEIHFFLPENEAGPEFHSLNRDKTVELLKTKAPFVYEKGKQTIYSDTDYMLLGLIIEAVTGMKQDEYVENEIYKPLGLRNTMYVPLKKGRQKNEIAATEVFGTTRGNKREYPAVRKYVLQGEVHDEKCYYSMDGISGHAGLFSTVEDLGVLMQVVLNNGGFGDVKVFDKNILDQFVKPSDFDITFGLGWRRAGNGGMPSLFGSYASGLAIGHTGWVGTATVIDPYYDLAIVLLTNKKHTLCYGNDPFPMEKFEGDNFLTGQYGKIISMVYEAFLNK